MHTPMNGKEFFISRIIEERKKHHEGSVIRVLELGCGTAEYIPAVLDSFQNIEYVGVEPIGTSYQKATEALSGRKNARLRFQLGYNRIEGVEEGSFDIVISISALEHVKDLSAFIAFGARYAKKDALVVHRYDLGHALYPGSLKERVHVFLGNTMPGILPERKFVRYLPLEEVVALYEKHHGTLPYACTYHQMPNHKELAKYATTEKQKRALMALNEWELIEAHHFGDINQAVLEKLFPTIAVWGRKA